MRLASRLSSATRPRCSPFTLQAVPRFPLVRHRSTVSEANATPATESLSPRWLADVKQRLGKCIMFGLKPDQTARAGAILQTVARDWRELVAGSEGFLTSEDRRGFHRHAVVWGEMDSMVGSMFCV